jgi:hypothetical protein
MTDKYSFPVPITLEAKSCGEPNAMWSRRSHTFLLCYELEAEFVRLYRDYKGREFPARGRAH